MLQTVRQPWGTAQANGALTRSYPAIRYIYCTIRAALQGAHLRAVAGADAKRVAGRVLDARVPQGHLNPPLQNNSAW